MSFFVKNKSFFFLIMLMFFVLLSCSSDPGSSHKIEIDGTFQKEAAVPSITVNNLNSNDDLLLAGTVGGVFKKRLDQPVKGWEASGLAINSAKVVDFIIWDGQEILASVVYSNNEKSNDVKPDLFKSNDGGHHWRSIKSFHELRDGEKVSGAPDLIEKSSLEPTKLFSIGTVSVDSGRTWSLIDYDNISGGFSKFFRISKFFPQEIWTGGVTAIFSPYIAKSEVAGDTWTRLDKEFYFNSDATVHDVVIHPDDSDQVLAGVSGSVSPARVIRKSTDRGQTWKTVFKGINTYTLTHSARDPQTVYASGRNPAGTLFFAVSSDFGDTWKTLEMKDSPAGIYVNDMISVMQDGHEVLYLGTNKGIYNYTFK